MVDKLVQVIILVFHVSLVLKGVCVCVCERVVVFLST